MLIGVIKMTAGKDRCLGEPPRGDNPHPAEFISELRVERWRLWSCATGATFETGEQTFGTVSSLGRKIGEVKGCPRAGVCDPLARKELRARRGIKRIVQKMSAARTKGSKEQDNSADMGN